MSVSNPPAEYAELHALIEQRTGVLLNDNRRTDINRAAGQMIETMHLQGMHNLIALLNTHDTAHAVWQALVAPIVVGETYFFRNQAHFNALRTQVFPALIQARRGTSSKQLRVWSAGCATGEEPYSLAILLREIIPDIDAWYITILATDINAESLQRARRGRYGKSAFRNETPARTRDEWFTAKDDGYELDPTIKRMVVFAPLNLVQDEYPSLATSTLHMDLIICRNVTIYFDPETTRQVIERFHCALVDDGWLIVGHSEPLATLYKGFVPRNFENAVFYQKQTLAAAQPEMQPLGRLSPPRETDTLSPSPRPAPRPATQPHPPPPRPVQTQQAWQRAKEAADREQWDEAHRWLTEADTVGVLLPQVHYLRALVYMQTSNTDAAVSSMRQAVAALPSFALAHYWLGELYEMRGNHAAAVRHWQSSQRAIQGLPSDQLLQFAEDLTVEMLGGLLAHRLGA
jgi:chemotaxis protein methyltransferase CheR